MHKRLLKYSLKLLTLITLFGFVLSSTGLCGLYMANCKVEMSRSCCGKDPYSQNSAAIKLEKKCCCEISEAVPRTAVITLSLNEIHQKNSTCLLNSFNYIFDKHEFSTIGPKPDSFHSPPREDIYIINSNFRI
jgi:hypothetical protein